MGGLLSTSRETREQTEIFRGPNYHIAGDFDASEAAIVVAVTDICNKALFELIIHKYIQAHPDTCRVLHWHEWMVGSDMPCLDGQTSFPDPKLAPETLLRNECTMSNSADGDSCEYSGPNLLATL